MSEYPVNYNAATSFGTSFGSALPVNRDGLSPDHSRKTYLKFIERIYSFEEGLDDNHEIGARLTSCASGETFHLLDVNFSAPHMISFTGETHGGKMLQLIQHISQLSVLLVAIEKRGKEPSRRIGVRLMQSTSNI